MILTDSQYHPIILLKLYCTVLYCTVLYCTVLYCTVLYCEALPALHCTVLHCTALHCTTLHCTALHCTALLCCIHDRFCLFSCFCTCYSYGYIMFLSSRVLSRLNKNCTYYFFCLSNKRTKNTTKELKVNDHDAFYWSSRYKPTYNIIMQRPADGSCL